MQTRVLRVLTGVETTEQVPGTHLLDKDGHIVDGTGDPLPTSDVGRIVYAYRRWRGEPAPAWWNEPEHGQWAFAAIPGFAKPATNEEIAKHGHVLTPGRYVGAKEQEDDAEPFAEKYPQLVAELERLFDEGRRLENAIRENLKGLSDAR